MNRKTERFKGQIMVTALAVLGVVLSMLGGSYALFSSSTSAGEYNVLTAGNLEISYVEGENGLGDILSLNGSYPQSDPTTLNNLLELQSYRFNITNTGNVPLDYRIKIEYDEAIIEEDGCGPIDSPNNNLLGFEYIKYNFDREVDSNDIPVAKVLGDAPNHIIYDSAQDNQPGLIQNGSRNFEIRLWIKSDAPNSILGKHFHGKVVVESVQSGVDMRLTTEYKIGDQVTLKDNNTYHVIENSPSTSATVKLLADTNVNTKAFDTENLRPTGSNSYCTNDEYGCNMYEANGSTVITDSSIKTWLDTGYLPSLKNTLAMNGGTVEDLTVSLPSMEELVKANKGSNKKFNQTIYTFDTSYLTSSSYWTQTAVKGADTSYVWYIDSTTGKSAIQYANNTTIGVRPVVVTSKLNVK